MREAIPPSDPRSTTIKEILRIVAGPAEVEEIARHMDEDVAVHMDGNVFHGLAAWRAWIRYSHAHCGLSETSLHLTELDELDDSRLSATITGKGIRAGVPVVSEPVEILYSFGTDGKVDATWTSRHNYTFFFGEGIRSPWGFGWLLLRIVLWTSRK